MIILIQIHTIQYSTNTDTNTFRIMSNNNNDQDDLPLRPDDDNDYPHIGEKVNFNGEEYYLYGVNTLAEAKGYERIRLGRHASIPDHNSFEVRTDKLDMPIIERGSRNRKTPVRINPSPSVLSVGNTHASSNITNPHLKKVSVKPCVSTCFYNNNM
jgi:hypothetical protein